MKTRTFTMRKGMTGYSFIVTMWPDGTFDMHDAFAYNGLSKKAIDKKYKTRRSLLTDLGNRILEQEKNIDKVAKTWRYPDDW